MKNYELFDIINVIDVILPKSKKVKLNMFLNLNKKIIENNLDSLKNSVNVSEKYKEYDRKRIELCKLYCDKDKNNEPILIDNKFKGLIGNKEFIEKLKELSDFYKNDINEYNNQIEQYNKLLGEDVNMEFNKFSLDIIPDDLIDGVQLGILSNLIEE